MNKEKFRNLQELVVFLDKQTLPESHYDDTPPTPQYVRLANAQSAEKITLVYALQFQHFSSLRQAIVLAALVNVLLLGLMALSEETGLSRAGRFRSLTG